jgi:YVTN family beta-propeller protein
LAEANGKIYFTAERSKVIGRCDVASRKVDWVLGIGQNSTHMIELTADRQTIVTTNIGSDSISLVKAQGKGWEIANVSVGKGPEGMDLVDGGKEIWVANSQDGTISIVDPAEEKVTQTIVVGTKRSNRLKFTPDGKLAFVSDLSGTDLVVIDVAKREVTKRIPLGGGAAGLQMDPSGGRAFVALPGKNEVVVVDLNSLEIAGRLATGKGPDGMAWVVRK